MLWLWPHLPILQSYHRTGQNLSFWYTGSVDTFKQPINFSLISIEPLFHTHLHLQPLCHYSFMIPNNYLSWPPVQCFVTLLQRQTLRKSSLYWKPLEFSYKSNLELKYREIHSPSLSGKCLLHKRTEFKWRTYPEPPLFFTSDGASGTKNLYWFNSNNTSEVWLTWQWVLP